MNQKQKLARQTNWDKRCINGAVATIKRVMQHAQDGTNRLSDVSMLIADLELAVSFLAKALSFWPKARRKR